MKTADIKKKVAAKVAKGKAKTAAAKAKVTAKCKGKKCSACSLALVAAISALLSGCQATPSRSQTLTMRDCVVNIYGGGVETNDIARVEIASQAMSIENSGTETLSTSQTTDTKPDVDVTVGGAKAGGGLLETVAGKLLNGSSGTTATESKTTTDYTDGSCSPNGACADGSCSL